MLGPRRPPHPLARHAGRRREGRPRALPPGRRGAGAGRHAPARAARERTARRALRADAAAAAERAAAADLETRERARELRRRDPRLSEPALAAARAACRRQVADSDPYMFAFGLQDVLGGAEGLFAARSALARRLAGSARDTFDRRKLRPLVRAIGAGNRELARLAAAEAAGDDEAVTGIVARLDAARSRNARSPAGSSSATASSGPRAASA